MGGNVFFGSSPIKKENIKPTLGRFVQELVRVFPGAKNYLEDMKTLGSAGKKAESGDIDLALDEKALKNLRSWGISTKDVEEKYQQFKKRARTATKAQLIKRAVIVCIAEKLELESSKVKVDTKGSGAGALYCQFPQFDKTGNLLDKEVQVDINVGSLDWLQFAYYSDSYKGNVKGLHRTQLVLTLFSNKGYVFSHNCGVKNKESQKIVADTPDQAIKLLSDLYRAEFTPEILNNYFKLQDFLKDNLDQEELHKIWDRFLRILDDTRCDIPLDLQEYWLDNQERLGLTGKFLPSDSKLFPFKED